MTHLATFLCLIVIMFAVIINGEIKSPNIIFILSDDLGHNDLGYSFNHQTFTPNIDKYRNNGIYLEWYYGQCNCSPTRSSIQTGRYAWHNGINSIIQSTNTYGVPLESKFISDILLDNGYSTAAIGKWHMGFYKWEYTPTFRGYESFYGYYGGGEDYYTHKTGGYYDFRKDIGINCGKNCSIVDSNAFNEYSSYLFTNRTIDVIREHDKSKPLFLYVAYQAVHSPLEVPKEYKLEYNNSNITNSDRLTYVGMTSCMDEGIGNITDVLEEEGYLSDNGNTIIIFSSDNGGQINSGGCNFPLRGGKQTVWEGGERLTSFIWSTPDIIPNNYPLRGGNYTQLMHITDWFPTIIEGMIGINISSLHLNYTIDGVNQWNGIIGSDKSINDSYFHYRDTIFYDHDIYNEKPANNTALRHKWYKILNGTGNTYSSEFGWANCNISSNTVPFNAGELYTSRPLYDLQSDPYEYWDLSNNSAYNNISNQLWSMLIDAQKSYIQQTNDPNCPKPTHTEYPVVGPVWEPWC